MNRRMYVFYFITAATLVMSHFSRTHLSGDEKKDFRVTAIRWSWPVALPKSSDKEIQTEAKRLAIILQMPETLWLADQNPGCCFWLEVKQWNPSPSEPGFIIVVQEGG